MQFGILPNRCVSDHLGYFPDMMPTLADLAGGKTPDRCDGISIVPTLVGGGEVGRCQRQHEYLYWEDPSSVAVRAEIGKRFVSSSSGQPGPWELYDLDKDIEEANNGSTMGASMSP